MYDTMSEALEAAAAKLVDEVVEPRLNSGAYSKTLQVQRRLATLSGSANRGPTPAEVARELLQGLKRQVEVDTEHAREYIQQVEEELVAGGSWGRKVLLCLTSSPRWLELRERS